MQFLAAARNRALEPLWQNATTLFGRRHGEVTLLDRHACSDATASSGPSSATWAAPARPITHKVSSAGVPVTVTDGAPVLATIRSSLPSCSLASTTPVGAACRNSRALFSRFQSRSDRPGSSGRSVQSAAPRRTSSWCTKYSTVLARSSAPGRANIDSRGGPPRNSAISSG